MPKKQKSKTTTTYADDGLQVVEDKNLLIELDGKVWHTH
jgi:hypothetical protein